MQKVCASMYVCKYAKDVCECVNKHVKGVSMYYAKGVCMYASMHIHIQRHRYIYTYIQAYTYTYTHTFICSLDSYMYLAPFSNPLRLSVQGRQKPSSQRVLFIIHLAHTMGQNDY